MDAYWNSWFHDQKLEPLRISYEQLSTGPEKVLAELMGHSDVDQKYVDGIAFPVANMADVTNKLCAKRLFI